MNEVVDFINLNRDRYIEELKAYLTIPSISALPEHAGDVRRAAQFTADALATAGLENLVFRNGTVGSIIYPGALFKVGGAVYGINSSAVIRNCRFEQNRSDYGGGAYLIYSNMLVEDCVFASNTGISQGGGLMVFDTTGIVRSCTFTANQCGIAGIGGRHRARSPHHCQFARNRPHL